MMLVRKTQRWSQSLDGQLRTHSVTKYLKKSPHTELSAQSSLSIFSQKYLLKCEDTYLILQNKYLHIYEDTFRTKILRDDCTQRIVLNMAEHQFIEFLKWFWSLPNILLNIKSMPIDNEYWPTMVWNRL